MFVCIISLSSSNLGHAGLKSRSLDQIEEKSCKHSKCILLLQQFNILQLPRASQIPVPSEVIRDVSVSTSFPSDGDAQRQLGVMGSVDFVMTTSTPSAVDQPQQASGAANTRLLDKAADDATHLIDEELLDLLAVQSKY